MGALPGMPRASFGLWKWASTHGLADELRMEYGHDAITGEPAHYLMLKGVSIARYTVRRTPNKIERNFFWFPPADLDLPGAAQIESFGVAANAIGDAYRVATEWVAVVALSARELTRSLRAHDRRRNESSNSAAIRLAVIGVGVAAAGPLGAVLSGMVGRYFNDVA